MVSWIDRKVTGARSSVLPSVGRLLGRSLFPFAALVLIASTVFYGPWVTLALAVVWWNVVTRVA